MKKGIVSILLVTLLFVSGAMPAFASTDELNKTIIPEDAILVDTSIIDPDMGLYVGAEYRDTIAYEFDGKAYVLNEEYQLIEGEVAIASGVAPYATEINYNTGLLSPAETHSTSYSASKGVVITVTVTGGHMKTYSIWSPTDKYVTGYNNDINSPLKFRFTTSETGSYKYYLRNDVSQNGLWFVNLSYS